MQCKTAEINTKSVVFWQVRENIIWISVADVTEKSYLLITCQQEFIMLAKLNWELFLSYVQYVCKCAVYIFFSSCYMDCILFFKR